MAIVTRTELEGASIDVQTLEDVVNGSEVINGTGLVTSREGTINQTLKKVINDLAEQDIGESAAAIIHARLDDLEARIVVLEP